MNRGLLAQATSRFQSRERIRRQKALHNLFQGYVHFKEKVLPLVLASVVVGLVITFISGIFRAPLSRIGVDVILRGAPLPWIIQVIPRAGHILWVQLAADAVFWVVISFAALTIMVYPSRPKH